MEEVYTSSSDFVKHLLDICEKLQIARVVVVYFGVCLAVYLLYTSCVLCVERTV